MSVEAATEARALLLKNCQGILSTNSVEMPGYPFGSVVPYCLDHDGNPLILISQIAQHTKNILQDPKVSLITLEGGIADVQTVGRLTWIADVVSLKDDAAKLAADRYYRYFPQARDYHKTHDFDFYRLDLVRARYIGGFGKIHWLESEQIIIDHQFSAQEEGYMLQHMNDDHLEAMQKYCATENISLDDDQPIMVGIDSEGFHLRLGARIIRFNFSEPATSTDAVRAQLVTMARQ